MWIFSKIFRKAVNQIIAKEVDKRRGEIQCGIVELDSIYNGRKKEYEVKIADIDVLKAKVEAELKELECIRIKSEEEQKRLWERLDILRDNLNTEDVWIKLWEMAYSKAVDAVWPILQKEMLHMVELAEQRAYIKSKEEFEIDLGQRMEHLMKLGNEKEMIPFVKVLALKKDIEDKKLVAERVKNIAQIERYVAQLEILEAL